MFSTITTGGIHGIESFLVQVEVDTAQGMPSFDMVGMLGAEVREARERVRVALRNSSVKLPPLHITVNISPADIRKEGAAFDLPIAIGIMVSLGYIPKEYVEKTLIIGELGLDGEVKHVKGVLPIVAMAKNQGMVRCILPKDNAIEGATIQGIDIIGVETFAEALAYCGKSAEQANQMIQPTRVEINSLFENRKKELDFIDINGQEGVKRAAMVAAAGFHHLLLIGPPGSGKTMIAKRIPSILPQISLEESLEVSAIYSVAKLLKEGQALLTERPFMSPHHTISEQALAGGGRIPRPGVLSLCHRGVLFLDELPEFSRNTIEVMRQPLENKEVHIARSLGNYTYPADFMLVGAMNPCPCGHYPDRNRCNCSVNEIKRYQNKISGPIMDRIDIYIEALPVKIKELTKGEGGLSSQEMRNRVMVARQMQEERFRNTNLHFNAELGVSEILKFCHLNKQEQQFMEQIFSSMNLSARGYHKILKVSRTIADLEGSEEIKRSHLIEAVMYRNINLGGQDNGTYK